MIPLIPIYRVFNFSMFGLNGKFHSSLDMQYIPNSSMYVCLTSALNGVVNANLKQFLRKSACRIYSSFFSSSTTITHIKCGCSSLIRDFCVKFFDRNRQSFEKYHIQKFFHQVYSF